LRRRKRPDAPKRIGTTIGDYIEAVKSETSIYPKTIESYSVALRAIATGIHGLPSARVAWKVKLASLAPSAIEAWRTDFIRRKAVNPLAEKSARVSTNSLIGRARALFSADIVAKLKDVVELPDPLPFQGVKVEKVCAPRYRSTFDMAALLEAAREELPSEQLKIFCSARWPVYGGTKSTSCRGPRFASTKE
jgi:hypothetical protein